MNETGLSKIEESELGSGLSPSLKSSQIGESNSLEDEKETTEKVF